MTIEPKHPNNPKSPKQASALWRFEANESMNRANSWYESDITSGQASEIIGLFYDLKDAVKDNDAPSSTKRLQSAITILIQPFSPDFKFKTIAGPETKIVTNTEIIEKEIVKTVHIKPSMTLSQVIETLLPVAKGITHLQDIFDAKQPVPVKAKTSKTYYKPKCFDTVLNTLRTPDINVLIKGPAGSGKSLMASELAKQLDLEFYAFSCSGSMRYGHVIGSDKLSVDPDTKQTVSTFELTDLMKAFQRPCLILMDECFSLAADILIGLNGLFEPSNRAIETRAGQVKLHADCKVIVAANSDGRNIDRNYLGAKRVDGSTLDRFVTFKIDYDTSVETNILNSLPNLTREYIKKNFYELREKINQNNILFDVSTRRLATCVKLVLNGTPCHDAFTCSLLGQLSHAELKKTGFDSLEPLEELDK
jgi:MoxR-like ATPase